MSPSRLGVREGGVDWQGWGGLNEKKHVFLAAIVLVTVISQLQAGSISLSPVYGDTHTDFTTGDNFVEGHGWFVDPLADSHIIDPLRERPLGRDEFYFEPGGNYVNPGPYYAYVDIKDAAFGSDDQYLYFKMTMFGKGSYDDMDSNMDESTFGYGADYTILLGQNSEGQANNSIKLTFSGEEASLRTGSGGQFNTTTGQGDYDANGDVGGSGINVTIEAGDTDGDGYESPKISGGKLENGAGADALFARIDPGEDSPTPIAPGTTGAMPVIEIALDYQLWNLVSSNPSIDPNNVSFIVFEANRRVQDGSNYLWNDRYTIGEEGSPYPIQDEEGDQIEELDKVAEVDRVFYRGGVPLENSPPTLHSPLPGNLWMALSMVGTCVAIWFVRQRTG